MITKKQKKHLKRDALYLPWMRAVVYSCEWYFAGRDFAQNESYRQVTS